MPLPLLPLLAGNIKWIVIGGVILLWTGIAFYFGYQFGGRKVAELEAQIESIRKAGVEAEAKVKQAQADADKVVAEKDAALTKALEDLKKKGDVRKTGLDDARKGTETRIASAQTQIKQIESRQAKLVSQLKQASAADQKKLQEQIDALEREKKSLMAGVDANRCLTLAVPDAIVGALIK